MRTERLLWLIGLCLCGPGCTLIENGAQNLIIGPLEYHYSGDRLFSSIRNRALANAAWDEMAVSGPEPAYSVHYERGFKDGFVDYLEFGGNGLPPPMPPRRYWKIHYQTPQGIQAIDDWYAGFSHGAAVARDSGYRQFVVIPTSAPPLGAMRTGVPAPPTQAPADKSSSEPETTPVLPPPKKLPPPPAPGEESKGVVQPAAGVQLNSPCR